VRERVLERKNSWALNEEELEISEELEDMIALVSELDEENQIFSSILKSFNQYSSNQYSILI
jgi:hypothetical protein